MPLATNQHMNAVDNTSIDSPSSLSELELSPEVRELCERHDLRDILELTLNLIQKHLRPEQVRLAAEHDPEENCEWIGIDALVRGNVAQIRVNDEAFTREWMKQAPQAQWNLIRVSCDILN